MVISSELVDDRPPASSTVTVQGTGDVRPVPSRLYTALTVMLQSVAILKYLHEE